MGLFSFLKNVGAAVLGGKNNAEDIEKMLNKELSGKILNLKAEVAESTAKLSGTCDSLSTKEKAILLTGNTKGIDLVDGDNLLYPEPKSAEAAAETVPELVETESSQFYEIKSGDTLSKIAKQYYGDANKYPLIFEANREVIKHPDKIYPGQQIRIPKLK
ncbi:MAG: peptidoglycan-binding protein LysM [Desulfobacterales bacterium]